MDKGGGGGPAYPAEVHGFLKEVVAVAMDDFLLRVARQAFITLTEFCQGPCPQNQVRCPPDCAWGCGGPVPVRS